MTWFDKGVHLNLLDLSSRSSDIVKNIYVIMQYSTRLSKIPIIKEMTTFSLITLYIIFDINWMVTHFVNVQS